MASRQHDFPQRDAPGPARRLWRAARGLYFDAADRLATPHPAPVFLLGNQKAGTSAIAALLGKLVGLPTAVDLRRENEQQTYLGLVSGALSFDAFVRRNALDFSRPIIKEPNLTLFHAELRQRYPDSRFAYIVRDPRDNLRSLLDWLAIPGDLAALEAQHMGRVDPGMELVLDGRWCGIGGGEHYVDRLAERWNTLADVYLERPSQLALIRYEDFVADKAGSLAQLAHSLGLEPRHDISRDLERAYRPRGRHGDSDWDAFFGANRARIEARCWERMGRFGYPVPA